MQPTTPGERAAQRRLTPSFGHRGTPLVLGDAGIRVGPPSPSSRRNCAHGTASPEESPHRLFTVGERWPAWRGPNPAVSTGADQQLDTGQRPSCHVLNSRSVTDRPLHAIFSVITAIPGGSCVTTRAEHQNNTTRSTEQFQIAPRSSVAVATVVTRSPDCTGELNMGSTWS